jgi:hypothetical protein
VDLGVPVGKRSLVWGKMWGSVRWFGVDPVVDVGFEEEERGMGKERIEDANSRPEVDVPWRRINVELWVRVGRMMCGFGWGVVSMLILEVSERVEIWGWNWRFEFEMNVTPRSGLR